MELPGQGTATGADRYDVARTDLAANSPRPVEGECLPCFIARVRQRTGCRGWELFATYCATLAPEATGLAGRYARLGALCACGLVEGVLTVAREHRERDVDTDALRVPDPLPACHGVRPGSARACSLWTRGRRREAGEQFGCLCEMGAERPFRVPRRRP